MAVTFVYVLGSRVTLELEHSHEVIASHDHHHHHHVNDMGGDHSHDHDPAPVSGEPDDESSGGDPHRHSHFVTLGMDTLFVAAAFPQVMPGFWTSLGSELPEQYPCPDAPCFGLIKPPQLG